MARERRLSRLAVVLCSPFEVDRTGGNCGWKDGTVSLGKRDGNIHNISEERSFPPFRAQYIGDERVRRRLDRPLLFVRDDLAGQFQAAPVRKLLLGSKPISPASRMIESQKLIAGKKKTGQSSFNNESIAALR